MRTEERDPIPHLGGAVMVMPGAVLLVVHREGRRAASEVEALEVEAEVLEVLGPHGGPPFVVRWADTGEVDVFVPDDDAFVLRQQHSGAAVVPGPGDRTLGLGNRA